MNPRIKNAYAALKKKNLDCLIVSSPANINYLTEYPGRDSYLLLSKKKNIYFTDSRYTEEAGARLKGIAEIAKIDGASVFKLVADACAALKMRRIGFEDKNLTFSEFSKIKGHLKAKAGLFPVSNLVEEFRQFKAKPELDKIQQAARITVLALKYIREFISPGKKEIEVAAELERFIRYHGATDSSFSIIVASGPNSSLPHHITSERRLKNNEPVLVDMGIRYKGYKSDLTRVFFLGKINSLYREIYDVVLKAQGKAIKKIKPDADIKEIDAAARGYISKRGFGDFFGHALGHGLGLEVHELPLISGKSSAKLKAGMVVTIEPGIYLPRKFGVRIEDMVLVTRKGYRVLSGSLNK